MKYANIMLIMAIVSTLIFVPWGILILQNQSEIQNISCTIEKCDLNLKIVNDIESILNHTWIIFFLVPSIMWIVQILRITDYLKISNFEIENIK